MEGYSIIVLLFGIIGLFLLIMVNFINRIFQYKNKIDNSFIAVKEVLLEQANIVSREIEFLNIDLAQDLEKFDIVQNFHHADDLKVLSNILINLCFTWAMSWITLGRQYSGMELELQKPVLKKQSITQVRLIFKGILNWQATTQAESPSD